MANMKMYSLGSIDPLNREAWRLGVKHSSHLLPTPVPGTPAAVKNKFRIKSRAFFSIYMAKLPNLDKSNLYKENEMSV